MILAGNQSKQRGPLHINLKNQDGVCQRQICVILHDRHTDIVACVVVKFLIQVIFCFSFVFWYGNVC